MQTKYLHFMGMSYENESYLCDIICVQLQKALAQFRCDNSQLEIVLGVWKGTPYTKRLCRDYNLGKVEDEKHLFLVYPNTQKVRERFCSPTQAQVCGMLPVPEDNLSPMIYLSSNGLSGPKWTLNCKQ
jgi:hypothetical protein